MWIPLININETVAVIFTLNGEIILLKNTLFQEKVKVFQSCLKIFQMMCASDER